MTDKERYYAKLYKKANKILDDKTPLKKDCGLVCGKACCKGDENTGMLLFPFEKTNFKVKENCGVRLAVCDGKCKRNNRPLSCKIFPFFPYVTPEGKIKVVPDVRGRSICPIVANYNEIKLDRGFLYRVKKLGRLLYTDELCRKFLEETSREIDFINSITD